MDQDRQQHIYKIVLIGDAGVGKTHLLNRYIRKALPPKIMPTIGVEFATMQIQLKSGETIKAQIWDTAGQERYRAITQAHYQRAVGAILVYDVTNNKTFENVKKWLEEVRENSDESIVLGMIGNKIDLLEQNPQQRKVGIEQANKYANEELLFFREISAFDGKKVETYFQDFFEEVYASLNAVYTETEYTQYDDLSQSQYTTGRQTMKSNIQQSKQLSKFEQSSTKNKQENSRNNLEKQRNTIQSNKNSNSTPNNHNNGRQSERPTVQSNLKSQPNNNLKNGQSNTQQQQSNKNENQNKNQQQQQQQHQQQEKGPNGGIIKLTTQKKKKEPIEEEQNCCG